MIIFHLIVLVVYHLAWIVCGWRVIRKWFPTGSLILDLSGAVIFGIGLGIPVTYALSNLFTWTATPIYWGTMLAGAVAISLSFLLPKVPKKIGEKPISISDGLFFFVSLLFATWLMTKTFHGDQAGGLFVGSNNVFDFGLVIGLTRSLSWGNNIPFVSPYFAGLPLFYHFFFTFWAGILEHFGLPIVLAINIPSIASFVLLLVVVYCIPQFLAKQKPIVGWVAALLTVTNSSLAFWHLVARARNLGDFARDIWRLPSYPFAGPFDGSIISIYMTLNNYINQRHLAFVIASGFFVFLMATSVKNKPQIGRVALLAVVTGSLFLWNIAICGLFLGLVTLVFVFARKWKASVVFFLVGVITALLWVSPMMPILIKAFVFIGNLTGITGAAPKALPTWTLWQYLWENLGLLPLVGALGFLLFPKKIKQDFLPFVVSFAGFCFLVEYKKHGFEQKFLSVLIIALNVLAATWVGSLFARRSLWYKIAALACIGVLTVSGFINLMPVKNEFAFPIVGAQSLPVITWIGAHTPKDAIFVSYADMIDPVVMAGRNNFFGFYGNVGWFDRSAIVAQVYGGDKKLAIDNNISFVLVPRFQKSDFPYAYDLKVLSQTYDLMYEDEKYQIFEVQ